MVSGHKIFSQCLLFFGISPLLPPVSTSVPCMEYSYDMLASLFVLCCEADGRFNTVKTYKKCFLIPKSSCASPVDRKGQVTVSNGTKMEKETRKKYVHITYVNNNFSMSPYRRK